MKHFILSFIFVLSFCMSEQSIAAEAVDVGRWCSLNNFKSGVCGTYSPFKSRQVTDDVQFILNTYVRLKSRAPTQDEFSKRTNDYMTLKTRNAAQIEADVMTSTWDLKVWCKNHGITNQVCAGVYDVVVLTDDDLFVLNSYYSLLNRAPSAEELASQSSNLSMGRLSRSDLWSSLASSSDSKSLQSNKSNQQFVKNLYLTVLATPPNLDNVRSYADKLTAGTLTRAQLRSQFMASTSYSASRAHSTNAAFVRNLYSSVAKSTPPEERVQYFANLLDTGARSRAEVTTQMAAAVGTKTKATLKVNQNITRPSTNITDVVPTQTWNMNETSYFDYSTNELNVVQFNLQDNTIVQYQGNNSLQSWTYSNPAAGTWRTITIQGGIRTDQYYNANPAAHTGWDPSGTAPIIENSFPVGPRTSLESLPGSAFDPNEVGNLNGSSSGGVIAVNVSPDFSGGISNVNVIDFSSSGGGGGAGSGIEIPIIGGSSSFEFGFGGGGFDAELDIGRWGECVDCIRIKYP